MAAGSRADASARCIGQAPAFAAIGFAAAACILICARYGAGPAAPVYCALVCVLLGISLEDLARYRIPNGLVLAGIAIWAVSLAAAGIACLAGGAAASSGFAVLERGLFFQADASGPAIPIPLAMAAEGLAGGLVVGGVALISSVVFLRAAGVEGMGAGDVKLCFMTALFLGVPLGVRMLLAACALAVPLALVWNGTGRRKARSGGGGPFSKHAVFPFGPAISVACALVLVLA